MSTDSTTTKNTALIIDTMSIQQYVFSSNKMRINLGASQIVSTFFTAINKDFENKDYEVGYIGGGNALFFFNNKEDAKTFIEFFSKEVLTKFPGLIINYAINVQFNREKGKYAESIKALFKNLHENKNKHIPITQGQKIQIATTSAYDANAASYYETSIQSWLSDTSKIKNDNNAAAVKGFIDKYLKETTYTFPLELEDVCLENEKGHIAVIHIDGNGFGSLFQQLDSLENARKLSIAVDELAEKSFKQLIDEDLIKVIQEDKENKIFKILDFTLTKKGKNIVLPIRPIIIGGDDICFITDGKLGIYLAEKFIAHFTNQLNLANIHEINSAATITACAGIAIVKRKFPFPKAYQLAEELCKAAKKEVKSKETVVSAINFHIANTGFAGTWEDIRSTYYQQNNDNLHFGPYTITTDEDKSLEKLKTAALHYHQNWAVNKLAKLKRVLWESKVQQQIFLEESKLKNKKQVLFGNKSNADSHTTETAIHYADYDRIELTDFYPVELLEKTIKKQENNAKDE